MVKAQNEKLLVGKFHHHMYKIHGVIKVNVVRVTSQKKIFKAKK